MKTETKKKWKYHISHKYVIVEGGIEVQMLFQLYQVSVYGIINNRSDLQGSYTPKGIMSIEKHLQKDLDKGKIRDLEFGREITVTIDDNGLFVEVQP